MLLAIDIGNTSVSFGLFEKSALGIDLIISSKISAQKNRSADEYAVLIKQILDMRLGYNYSIDSAAISSVVPSITRSVKCAAESISGTKPFMILPGTKTGFKISVNDPASLGTDIVANVAAALNTISPPLVIFDAGTANTITVVDNSGTVVGTVITPGIRISASALFENAELLDTVSFDSTDLPLIGKNTKESVRSGLLYGNAIMIDGFVRNIRESLIPKNSDCKLGLIATGGLAKPIVEKCRNKFTIDESLTLRGIAVLFYSNTGK